MSCEQYFQANKFPGTDYYNYIRGFTDGNHLRLLGQNKKYKCRDDWEEVKVEIMYKANLEKFSQNEKMKEELINTEGDIEAGGFPFWALWNAVILMRIREELRAPEKRNQEKLNKYVQMMEDYKQENKFKK